MAEDLAVALLIINNQYDIEEFEVHRARALISLVVVVPEQISK